MLLNIKLNKLALDKINIFFYLSLIGIILLNCFIFREKSIFSSKEMMFYAVVNIICLFDACYQVYHLVVLKIVPINRWFSFFIILLPIIFFIQYPDHLEIIIFVLIIILAKSWDFMFRYRANHFHFLLNTGFHYYFSLFLYDTTLGLSFLYLSFNDYDKFLYASYLFLSASIVLSSVIFLFLNKKINTAFLLVRFLIPIIIVLLISFKLINIFTIGNIVFLLLGYQKHNRFLKEKYVR